MHFPRAVEPIDLLDQVSQTLFLLVVKLADSAILECLEPLQYRVAGSTRTQERLGLMQCQEVELIKTPVLENPWE